MDDSGRPSLSAGVENHLEVGWVIDKTPPLTSVRQLGWNESSERLKQGSGQWNSDAAVLARAECEEMAFGWVGMHGMDIRSFDNICAAAVSAALLFLVLLVWLLCCFSERHCWVFPWQCHMQLVIQRTCSYTLRPLSRLPIKCNGTMLFFIYAHWLSPCQSLIMNGLCYIDTQVWLPMGGCTLSEE